MPGENPTSIATAWSMVGAGVAYDDFGRLVRGRVDTDGGVQTFAAHSYSTSFPLSAKTVLPSGSGSPDYATRKFVDGLGRWIHTVKTGSDGKYVRSGRIIYDATGRIARRGQSDWADSAELEQFFPNQAERHATQYQYDPVGRIKTTILPIAEGETTAPVITSLYNDPFETTELHSGGKSKRIVKNARGQILYVEDAGADGTNAKIGFCYDLAGNRTKKSDVNSGTLTCSNTEAGVATKDTSGNNHAYWLYDAFGQLRKSSDPDLGTGSYEYNAFGDLTRRTDARGLITTLAYDGLGRVTAKSFPEGTTHFVYDTNDDSDNALGKLVLVKDGAQTKTFSYDKVGRLKRETRMIHSTPVKQAEGPFVTDYQFDLLGRVVHIDYPEHPISHARMRACYSYGTAGYVTGISVKVNTNTMLPGSCDKTIVEGITYNEFGQTAGFTLGNGIATSYTYDIKGRLARIVSSGEVDGTTKTLQNAVYTFNEQNNITHVENNSSDYETSYSYGYDGLNRLTTASGRYVETLNATGTSDTVPKQFQQSYSYADNGNLTSKRIHDPASGSITDEWTYRYANHAVTRIDSTKSGGSTIAMDYDESGNMVEQIDTAKSANKRIEVDSQDRIVRVRNGANHAIMGEYVYDEGGFRVRKSARFVKAGVTQDVEILYPSKFYGLEYSSEANTLSSVNNIYLNGVRIAALNEGGGTAYYLTDQVDSVSTVLDEDGKTLSRIQYQPYGETFVHKGDTDFSPKYNSQELDKETNFYFYNARYYDPAVARFTSADTVIDGQWDTQGWNRYSYVKGNPIRYKDPTGHEGEVGEFLKGFGEQYLENRVNQVVDHLESMNPVPVAKEAATAWYSAATGDFDPLKRFAEKTPAGILVKAGVNALQDPAKTCKNVQQKLAKISDDLTGQNGPRIQGRTAENTLETTVQIGALAYGGYRTLRGLGPGPTGVAGPKPAIEPSIKGSNPPKLHGNDLRTPKPAEGYTLRDRDSGNLLKYGETTRGPKRYSQRFLEENNAEMVFEANGTKAEMHRWQHEKILQFKAENGGVRPPLNKSDY